MSRIKFAPVKDSILRLGVKMGVEIRRVIKVQDLGEITIYFDFGG